MNVVFHNLINDDFFENLKPSKSEELFEYFIKKEYNIHFGESIRLDPTIKDKTILLCTINKNLRINEGDAGIDLSNIEDIELKFSINDYVNKPFLVKTGCKIYLPKGISALVLPRSSSGLKYGYIIPNSPGLIDSTYRGDIGIIINILNSNNFMKICMLETPSGFNQYPETYVIKKGTRLAQLLIIPNIYPTNFDYFGTYYFIIIRNQYIYDNFENIFPSDRGEKGFGSTGI